MSEAGTAGRPKEEAAPPARPPYTLHGRRLGTVAGIAAAVILGCALFLKLIESRSGPPERLVVTLRSKECPRGSTPVSSLLGDPTPGRRYSYVPWTGEGAAGRLEGTGTAGPALADQYRAYMEHPLAGPDPLLLRESGAFSAADFVALRARADTEGRLKTSYRAKLDASPGLDVMPQLALGGVDVSGKRVVLLTGTGELKFLENVMLWLAHSGMITRAVVVMQTEEDCRRLEGVVPCWWHDTAMWGDTFRGGIHSASALHCRAGEPGSWNGNMPVCTKWYWAWRLVREGVDVLLSDSDLAFFRNLVADDYPVWQGSWDVAALSDSKLAGDPLDYCKQGPCVSTGLVFLRATPATLALLEDTVSTLEAEECVGWEQPLFNGKVFADKLPMDVAAWVLPRRHMVNLSEVMLQVDRFSYYHAPVDYHVLHAGYTFDKMRSMWCMGLLRIDPTRVDPALDWSTCPAVNAFPGLTLTRLLP